MSPTLLTALIAATVSLVGVLASLIIAGRSARAAREQVALVEWLKDQRTSVDRIRAYAVEVEKFRSACWLLHMAAEKILRSSQLDQEVLDTLLQNYEKVNEVFEKYWSDWAETKSDIPEEKLVISRIIRHEARNHFSHLQVLFNSLQRAQNLEAQRRNRNRNICSVASHIQDCVTGLLELLDRQHALMINQLDMSSLALLTSVNLPKPQALTSKLPNLTVEREAAKARRPSP
jgi:hypothetical protein